MANRNLSIEELAEANILLSEIRNRLLLLAKGDNALLFAFRRKIAKELTYDERGKPMQRKLLKLKKMAEQGSRCVICAEPLPATHAVLDRIDAVLGYTAADTRLIHAHCDTELQSNRGYR